MTRQLKISAAALLLGAGLFVNAHADEPFWSLFLGAPGVAAQLGNVPPPQPVVVSPPVVYAPQPAVVYPQPYVVQPAYAPPTPARWYGGEEDRRWHGDDERWHGDH